MKKIRFFTAILIALIVTGFSLTSCLNSDNDNTPQTMAAIVTVDDGYLGTVSFKTTDGYTLYPTSASLASVETNSGFKSNSTKMAYILYTVPEQEINESTKTLNIILSGAVSIDATTQSVVTPGASNDSVYNSSTPIISIDKAFSTTNELYVHNGRYLLLGINYFIYSKVHYLTMVYYPEEITENSTEIKFYLRHNKNGDTGATSGKSYDLFRSYPQFYYKSYDIGSALYEYKMKTGNSSVTINVEADVNVYSTDGGSIQNYKLLNYNLNE